MNIADFLEVAEEAIVAESVAYAKTMLQLRGEQEAVLRNHLPQMLQAISTDLRTPQSRDQSIRKSQGLAPARSAGDTTAAETHGLQRARSGLQCEQVVAEYRALRACVLRLWSEAAPPTPESLADVGRFNEAIDQALAESVAVYANEVERWQRLFLGIVGHDLRSPLNAITLTTEIIDQTAPPALSRAVATLRRSAKRMASLLDSLLEYNRSNFGSGMPIEPTAVDLAAEIADEVELQRSALPGATIELAVPGPVHGHVDRARVREALGNLVTNAVKHGVASQPVLVTLEEAGEALKLSVDNAVEREIPGSELEPLFEPLRRGAFGRPGGDRSHLGLGLFIVRQIAKAHGGTATAACDGRRMRFTISLPKQPPPRAAG